MTINPHEASDRAHNQIKALCAKFEQDVHGLIQALDNRAALAGHWEGVASAQRAEIERLRARVRELETEQNRNGESA
jgi:hypothetical protein